jgi:hypothetical protein
MKGYIEEISIVLEGVIAYYTFHCFKDPAKVELQIKVLTLAQVSSLLHIKY